MDNIPDDTQQRYIQSRCDTSQVMFERVAWAEAGILANAFNQWVPGGGFQNAMDFYMGPDTANGQRGQNGIVYQDAISDIRDKEYHMHTGRFAPLNEIHIFCDEQDFDDQFFKDQHCDTVKRTCCESGDRAYTFNVDGWAGENHNTVFCPTFWTLPTLSEQVRYLKNSDNFTEKTVVNKLWNNIGGTYFHESIHWAPSISQVLHRPGDFAYGPWAVRDLAKQRGTRWAWQNAESYLIAAIAMFQQQTFCLAYPPTPDDNDRPKPPSSLSIGSSSGEVTDINLPHAKMLNGRVTPTWPNSTDTSYWMPSAPLKLDLSSYVGSTTVQTGPMPSCIGTTNVVPSVQRDYALGIINNNYCPYMTTGNTEVGPNAPMFILPTSPYGAVGYPASDAEPIDPEQSLWFSISLVQTRECATGFQVAKSACENASHCP